MTTTDHRSESARLDAVRRYDVLDTPPDGAFDRVTALASVVVMTSCLLGGYRT